MGPLLVLIFSYPAISQEKSVACRMFISTNSTGLNFTVNEVASVQNYSATFSISSLPTGNVLWQGEKAGEKSGSVINFQLTGLNPDLWSPVNPALYQLKFRLNSGKIVVMDTTVRIGFRDFQTKEGKIFLNGHPIFLRGIAINPPGRGIPAEVENSRKFALDYVSFMKSIHVNIIRIPDSQTWYDVCDELGMMVFGGNYSELVAGQSPPKDYDRGVSWYQKDKFQPIMHHPALMIYALTNEVPFQGSKAKEWVSFLDYAFDKLKNWDPSRLYIGNAGYGYGKSGDINDLHRYWGWYYASPFTFLHVRDYDSITFPGKTQPLTFTECVGNYTGPDGRYNLTPNHKNPVSQQNWTGHAPQDLQSGLADQHQSFVVKQATELLRRLRAINPESSGVFPFTIMFRNWHTVQNFVDMDPKPVTQQFKKSYQPVLLSWENWQSQVYAGSTIHPRVHLVNDADDFSDLKNLKLVVRLLDKALTVWKSDTLKISDLPYYQIRTQPINLSLPSNLFTGIYQLEGILFSGAREVSRNSDPLYIENQRPANNYHESQVVLYDPNGKTKQAFEKNCLSFREIKDLQKIDPKACLVIGENCADKDFAAYAQVIREFLKNGGRMIVLKQELSFSGNLARSLPVEFGFPRMDIDNPSYPPPPRPSYNSPNINPERPDHPVFVGISRDRLRIWSDYTSWDETKKGFPSIYPVTAGFILKNKEDVGKTAVLANYSVGLEGIALAEIFEGKGSLLVSGFDLCNRAGIDPVADRLLINMVRYMSRPVPHEKYVYVEAPILWGEYEMEKGILTGINSGFLLNAKPALYGSYENLPLIMKDGYLFAEKSAGWNTTPGKEYVPYGRRMYGPYKHRDFGGVPVPLNKDDVNGEAFFWCKVPVGTQNMTTIVWNPAESELPISILINDKMIKQEKVRAGEYKCINTPLKNEGTELKVGLKGDNKLVILQTAFN